MVVCYDPGDTQKLVSSLHQAEWVKDLTKALEIRVGESSGSGKFSNQFEIRLDDSDRLRSSEENLGYYDVKRIPSFSPWKHPLVRP